MTKKTDAGTHIKEESPRSSKSDELVLRPQPSRRITVKGKIASIRPAEPKLKLDD
jgi:hypothetical protein